MSEAFYTLVHPVYCIGCKLQQISFSVSTNREKSEFYGILLFQGGCKIYFYTDVQFIDATLLYRGVRFFSTIVHLAFVG